MFYTIYKITNKINDKFYIGMHKTSNLDDGYMGSGKLIKAAIKKYGIDSFTKEILYIFDNEEGMKAKEKELVVLSEQSYNLCEGGHGGFGYINRTLSGIDKKIYLATKKWKDLSKNDPNWLKNRNKLISEGALKDVERSSRMKIYFQTHDANFKGKKHSQETKNKLKNHTRQTGIKNSQYGTCWITNGQENKKIKKEELGVWVDKGYHKGRIMLTM